MRRPIQVQLLFPFLSVVLLAIVLASGTIACLGVNRANRRQQDDLARVVATLTDATFPLSKDVLRQMSGLSGAEFVVFDADSRLLEHTLPLGADELESLRRLPEGNSPMWGGPSGTVLRPETLAAEPAPPPGETGKPNQSPLISGRTYFAWRMPVTRRGTAARPNWLVVLYPEDQWWIAAQAGGFSGVDDWGRGGTGRHGDHHRSWRRRFVRPIRETRKAGGGDRPGAVPAAARLSPRRRDSRSDPVDQLHGGDARPLRAVGPPQRTLADARAAWRRHGPSTPQCGDRGVDGRRTAPAAVSRRAGPAGPGSGRPPIAT